jgi:hypothetical protein
MDLPMATLILPADLDGSAIQAIQLAISIYSETGRAMKVSVRRANVLAIPLHAGSL